EATVAIDTPGVYVDGSPTNQLPTTGIRLVQRTDDGRWRTFVMHGEPIDPDALAAPFEEKAHWRWRAELGAIVGAGGGFQRREDWPMEPDGGEPVVPDDNWFVA